MAGRGLRMKYLLKRFYFNFKEYQFRNLYSYIINKKKLFSVKPSKPSPKHGKNNNLFIGSLESTLSSVLFRTGFFVSPHAVRFAVAHKQILLNNSLIKSTKLMLKDGDILTFVSEDLKKKFLAFFIRRLLKVAYFKQNRRNKLFRPSVSVLCKLVTPIGKSRYLLLMPKLASVQFLEKPIVRQVYYPFPLNLLEFNAHYKAQS